MRTTRFPEQADGPAMRMADFIAHLRMNGLRAGPSETAEALSALGVVDGAEAHQARLALKTLLSGDAEAWRKFDDLFDAFWFNAGKQRPGADARRENLRTQTARPTLWQPHFNEGKDDGAAPSEDDLAPDASDGEAEGNDGKLIATLTSNLRKRDLRELVDEDTLRAAEREAERLARAIRDRRSRRRKQARRGDQLDLRRIMRASLQKGGEPIELHRRKRPDRPMRIVVLCDVSGSMTIYARVFLAFVKGLLSADAAADAYLFHTRLLRITPVLRDHDTLRAVGRLSLMAEGCGGGTDITGSLTTFLESHGARTLDQRTVVLILSDGYCTSSAEGLGDALARIRKKARRIVWLNPLKGWRDYEPIAAGMQAAAPYLDAHLAANTIEALGALEPEFQKL